MLGQVHPGATACCSLDAWCAGRHGLLILVFFAGHGLLRRLQRKDSEWRKTRRDMNRIWSAVYHRFS